jgi:hypothetical protein
MVLTQKEGRPIAEDRALISVVTNNDLLMKLERRWRITTERDLLILLQNEHLARANLGDADFKALKELFREGGGLP